MDRPGFQSRVFAGMSTATDEWRLCAVVLDSRVFRVVVRGCVPRPVLQGGMVRNMESSTAGGLTLLLLPTFDDDHLFAVSEWVTSGKKAVPIRDRRGILLGTILIFRDVTGKW